MRQAILQTRPPTGLPVLFELQADLVDEFRLYFRESTAEQIAERFENNSELSDDPALVVTFDDGSALKLPAARRASLKDWSDTVEHTYYLLGSALGPHPYPTIVRDFQEVIGREVRQQILEKEGIISVIMMHKPGRLARIA